MIFRVENGDTKSDNGTSCWNLNSVEHLHTLGDLIFPSLSTLSHQGSLKINTFKQVNLFIKCELFTHVFQALLEKEKERNGLMSEVTELEKIVGGLLNNFFYNTLP